MAERFPGRYELVALLGAEHAGLAELLRPYGLGAPGDAAVHVGADVGPVT